MVRIVSPGHCNDDTFLFQFCSAGLWTATTEIETGVILLGGQVDQLNMTLASVESAVEDQNGRIDANELNLDGKSVWSFCLSVIRNNTRNTS